MLTEKIRFKNRHGLELAARIDLPVDGAPRAWAIFAHCFTCTMNLKAVANINRALAAQGIAVLRFDFTGLGESEGDFADTNFSGNISDLVDAATFLAEKYQPPKLLIGHSLGGAAVLHATAAIPSVLAVATIGAPFRPGHVAHLLDSSREKIDSEGEAEVRLAGRPFRVKKQFLDDLQRHDAVATIRNLRRALIVFHSPIDDTVSVDNAGEIFTAALHPKSFVSLDRADHLLSRNEDSLFAGSMIATWARKHLGIVDKPRTLAELGESQVVVQTGKQGFLSEINANGHALLADEPSEVGGSNLGPSPYDYLVTALGTCTGMTLRSYADRKGWPLESVTVRLRHEKIHAADCADCETKVGKIDQIERSIELAGNLSEEQRQALLEIADKCPVHRTLHGEVVVRTTLAA